MSKPEIKQYLEKLYNFKIDKLNTFIQKGKVMKLSTIPGNKKTKKRDYKKAFVKLDVNVPAEFQKLDPS